MNLRESMKVLFIGATTKMGGGPRQMLHLIEGLKANQVDVFLIIPDDGSMFTKFQSLDIPVFPIPIRKLSLISWFRVFGLVWKTKPDIIHTNGIGAGIYGRVAGKLLGKKVVHTYHGFNVEFYPKIKKFLYLLTEKFLDFFTDKAIAVSQGEKEYLLGKKVVSYAKILKIYNGIPIGENESGKSPGDTLMIGTLSRIDFQKGLDLLLAAIPHLKKKLGSFKIQIVGGMPVGKERYLKQLQQIMEENDEIEEHVEMLGEVEDVNIYLENFDIFISTARWEGFPLSLLEAGAKGKFIVASDVIGNNEIIIDEKTGFLIHDLSPEGIAERIFQAVNCPEKDKITQACMEHIRKNFSVEQMVSQTNAIYKN